MNKKIKKQQRYEVKKWNCPGHWKGIKRLDKNCENSTEIVQFLLFEFTTGTSKIPSKTPILQVEDYPLPKDIE